MSAKYNCKHPNRGRSNYPKRLTARGFSKAPQMETLKSLRERQGRRVEATCTLAGDHDFHECDGVPFPNMTATLEEVA